MEAARQSRSVTLVLAGLTYIISATLAFAWEVWWPLLAGLLLAMVIRLFSRSY